MKKLLHDKPVFIKSLRNPALTAGGRRIPFLSWDGLWVYHPNILTKDGRYYMLYTGRGGVRLRHQIGLASSDDIFTWKKYPRNPVFRIGSTGGWDDEFVAHGCVFEEGRRYYMFYSGCSRRVWREEIGLASSDDLVTWTRYEQNPVLRVGTAGTWEGNHVSRCFVIKIGGRFHLYYAGHDGGGERIGLATSNDLYAWRKFRSNPILDLGPKGSWDEKSISDPRVHQIGEVYFMQYSGYDSQGVGRIGLAFSKDALRWTKFRGNPVLDVGGGGRWDRREVCRADLVKLNEDWYVFYSGFDGVYFGIGVAEGRLTLDNSISVLGQQI